MTKTKKRLVLGLIVIVILAVLMILRPFQRSQSSLTEVALLVRADGAVDLNGNRYTGLLPLQAALVDACSVKPRPLFRLNTESGAKSDTVQDVIAVAQKAGCM